MGLKYADPTPGYSDPASSGMKVADAGGTWEGPDAGRLACDATADWSAPELGPRIHYRYLSRYDDGSYDSGLDGPMPKNQWGAPVCQYEFEPDCPKSAAAGTKVTVEVVDTSATHWTGGSNDGLARFESPDRTIDDMGFTSQDELGFSSHSGNRYTFTMPDHEVTVYSYCLGDMHYRP